MDDSKLRARYVGQYVLHSGLMGLCGLTLACQRGEPPSQERAKAELPVIIGNTPEAAILAESETAQAEHCDQAEMNAILDPFERFIFAFDCGDELFEVQFNELDGVGANVGAGQRFTRVPRADLNGPGEWANHTPARATGPNAQACNHCHEDPFDDGAGAAVTNAIRDPLHTGNISQFISRNTPHVFGVGALQRLAEEMTDELAAQVNEARTLACEASAPVDVALVAKGIAYGSVSIACSPDNDDTSGVEGIDPDLVVKPLQWKGDTTTVRDFNRGAAHNELGMQAVEITGDNVDGDGDGVMNELGVGDMTAMAIYLAAQPRPVTLMELVGLGLADVAPEEVAAINEGEQVFAAVGCADCHTPELVIDDPVFSEPSQHPAFRDATFPAGQDPIARGVDPANPISFNLTTDLPDNHLALPDGAPANFGSFEATAEGGAIVRLFGDLKRHDMGANLGEAIDEVGSGPSVWLTKELWGVGSTAPYLHDGRATTLMSAILEHGGEAQASRDATMALSVEERNSLVAFLRNLVLLKLEEAEEPTGPAGELSASFATSTDWGAGYCGELQVTNNSDAPTTGWSVSFDTNGATITGSWNGDFSGNSGTVTVIAPFAWNQVIAPSVTNTSIGFCATREDPNSSALPTNLVASGSF